MGHFAERPEKNRTSEAHYKALIEMAADAIVSIDHEGKVILLNPAAKEIFGYGQAEAVGKNLEELIVPEQSRDLFHACLSGGPLRDMEMELTRRDGSMFPAELSFSQQMKSDEGSERTIIVRDITERKRTEEAIRNAALFPEQNPSPVLRVHRDGTLLFSNPAAEPVLAEWRATSGGGFPARVRQCVEEALSEGVSRDLEIRIADRDFSFVVNPIKENNYANLYGRDITDRKQVEEAFRKSAVRLQLAHDAAKAGTWEWDLQTNENIWSEELWKLYGLDSHNCEPTYETWRQTIHPDDREKTEQIVQKAATHEAELNAEWRVIDRDGSIRWLMSRGQPQVDVEGRPMRYIGIVVDITGRKRAEEALRGSEARYRSYIEVTGQLGWTTNADGEIVEDIPGWRQYTGQTFDEMRGWGWSEVLHPDDVEITLAVWRKAVEEKQGYETEYRLRRHDGVYRHFLARGLPVLQDDGSVREWVGTCIDITDRKQTEEKLRRNEARFRQLADSMPQLVWTAEPDGRVDYYNNRLSLFSTHGPLTPIVYTEDRPRTVEAWKNAVRTGSPYEVEHRLQIADGRFRWFLTRAVPVPDEAGNVMKWYGTSTDVHDRKQAEEEREIARIEAINEKNRLEAIMDTLPVGVAVVDETGGHVRSNRMYDNLWGESRPEARSVDDYSKYRAWWLDSGRQVRPEEWASALAVKKGKIVSGQFMRIERFDGTNAFVMNSAAPIYDFDDRIAGSAVAILDITERIEAEQALQKAKEELENKVRERTAELVLLMEDLEKSRDDLRKLASELIMTEERERKKISVTLHDEVAQTLAAARMRIDLLRSKPGDDEIRRTLTRRNSSSCRPSGKPVP
jgi:PAS domain S-box-containing protein